MGEAAVPKQWFTLGLSGDRFLNDILIPLLPDWIKDAVAVTRIRVDRNSGEVSDRNSHLNSAKFENKSALIIDSAIHSGRSMGLLSDKLFDMGVSSVLSYSLVLKRTSEFIPSFFGLLIDEHDRAFFQLEKIPNNRLYSASSLRKTDAKFGSLRALREADVHRIPNSLKVDVASIDKISFADLWYSTKTQNTHVFVYEVKGEICGYTAFKHEHETLFIDTVAVAKNWHGAGIGASMMRWVESYARSSKCKKIELWAIDERVEFYRHLGFEPSTSDTMDLGGGEKYKKMSRRILYNVKPVA